jgi:hypothetical protein
MELIETLQGHANSISSVGNGHTLEKSSTRRRPAHSKKQGSQNRKKARPAAKIKLAAISGAK